jgi:hypothetical protein
MAQEMFGMIGVVALSLLMEHPTILSLLWEQLG